MPGELHIAGVVFGVFAMFVGLTVINSIYATIVQVKIPARFHGRVFAVNTLFAFCTLPLGFVVVGPAVSAALTPCSSRMGRWPARSAR